MRFEHDVRMKTITLPLPDDWHIHLREGSSLANTVKAVNGLFSRLMVMPNLTTAIDQLDLLEDYARQIDTYRVESLTPYYAIYLTRRVTPELITAMSQSRLAKAVKFYPQGATTHSQSGIRDIEEMFPVLEQMEALGVPLLIHGETPGKEIDIFDREKHFLDNTWSKIRQKFPELRMVLEHVTTKDGIDCVRSAPSHVCATITAHHLLLDRNDLINAKIHPHLFCLPVLKRSQHREALVKAATSGDPHFFFGSDSAPHTHQNKFTCQGCAGIFSSPVALSVLASVFEQTDSLDQLANFTSANGADFYQVPRETRQITLEKKPWQVPNTYPMADSEVMPLCANDTLEWQVVNPCL